ncbi:autotransporter domain-containing protein [Aquamicrobium sp. LC103]|uniref:autotransporter domain-containing protein n=1 Tax=Aquamicrobium sp. LC103 TaxID=1120658 RepID=UPI00063EA7DE|nr:autotransporter domain-containing protein [Aquamicrobium sp. LC103]TKT69454.1 autotransporter domain-containing protein [Aquamicrobium sp. LC103]
MSTFVSTFRGKANAYRRLMTMALTGVSATALTLALTPARAEESIDSGQIVTVPGDHPSPWNLVGETLIVGDTGAGTLIIENGGIVSADVIVVGRADNGVGTVTVSGTGSDLTATGLVIQVGSSGKGTVTVNDGASLSSTDLVVGHFNEGTLTVTGNGSSFALTDHLGIGSWGKGTASLTDGAVAVTGGLLTLGVFESGDGSLDISGEGTSWEVQEHAFIGNGGRGDLQVRNGASLDVAQTLNLGDDATGSGRVTVSGTGARLIFGDLMAGVHGSAVLYIENGGALGNAGHNAVFGIGATGTADMVIKGQGSTFTANLVTIAEAGKATISVSDGAWLETGITSMGQQAGSVGEVHLSGPGTVWANTADDIYVGQFGEGIVTAGGGARIDAVSYVRLGADVNGRGTIALMGASTALEAGVAIEIAKSGLGEFTVAGGASVKHDGNLLIGQSNGSMGIAEVSGSGSSWQGLGDATIGESGIGTFAVTDGATASLVGNTVVGAVAGGGALWADGGAISTGTLTLGDAGAGTLVVENGGSVTVGGGAGTVLVGTQAGSHGTISIGNGNSAGTIGATRIQFGAGDSSLFFSHTDEEYRFDPILKGNADIEHGGGRTILTADSALFSGMTRIWGGTLVVDGVLGGTVDVDAGGTLGGSGAAGDVTVASNGTVAPGNSIGTLDVGSIIFDAGSQLVVEVNGLGNADLVNAAGTATINGGLVDVLPLPDVSIDTPYAIVTAGGGVVGGFDGVAFASGSLFITPMLTYDASNAYVTLAQTTDFADVALTPNQKAAASGIQSVGAGQVFSAIAALGDIEDARDAFDAVSGEIHASAKTVLVEDSRFTREAAISRIRAASDSVAAPQTASVLDGIEFWGQGFGARGEWESDGNAASLERSLGGFVLGTDAAAGDWRLGLLAGYGHTEFDVDDRSSSGSAASYHLGAYGGTEIGGFGVRLGGAYSWHDMEIDRTAAFNGFSDTLSSSYRAGTGQLFGELGYGFTAGAARFEPFANLAHVRHSTRGFAEDGGAAALNAARETVDATYTTLGVRAETELAMGQARTARLTGMVGWRHAFGNGTPDATLYFGGGDAFTVSGVSIARDALTLEAGVDIDVSSTASFAIHYSGQIASRAQDHGVKTSFNVQF